MIMAERAFLDKDTRASCGIELDAGKAKVERFVPARFVAVDIKQITERDPRRQGAARAREV